MSRIFSRGHRKGAKRSNAKLNDEKVRAIRKMAFECIPRKVICEEFDISPGLASEVINRKRWAHVK